jgi:hypothetical protein
MNSSSAVIEMTPHGMQRCSQRAVSPRKIDIVVNYIKPIRSSNYYIFAVGKKDITRLLDQGIINKQEADKLQFLILVTDYNNTTPSNYILDLWFLFVNSMFLGYNTFIRKY